MLFLFENALEENGLVSKYLDDSRNDSMFLTTKMLNSAGIFSDVPYVISVRAYKPADLKRLRDITRKFTKTHGEPIDWGYYAVRRLGLCNLNEREFGDRTLIAEDEIPVFGACGVTPQIAPAKLNKKIEGTVFGHAPGHMLVLDLRDGDVVSL